MLTISKFDNQSMTPFSKSKKRSRIQHQDLNISLRFKKNILKHTPIFSHELDNEELVQSTVLDSRVSV